MHIVHVIGAGGGPEAYVKMIRPWLEEQGHCLSVIYVSGGPVSAKEFPPSVRVYYAPPGQWHYYAARGAGKFRAWALRLRARETAWAAAKILREITRAQPIDLIEVIEGIPLAPLKPYGKVLVRAHGADWTVRQMCGDADTRANPWLIRQEARQLRDADGVSALSEHLAELLSRSCNYPRDKIRVIPYPIDTETFKPGIAQTDPPLLLSVGRIETRKGTDTLVRAMPHVWESYPNAELVLLGAEGNLTRELLLRDIPRDKQDQIRQPGFLSRAEIVQYYQRTTLYVAPTQYETFGYTILEAMACGVPVISTPVGAVPELVKHGVTGMLAPFGDVPRLAQTVVHCLDSRARMQKMGERGRAQTSQYTMEQVMPQLIDSYLRVL